MRGKTYRLKSVYPNYSAFLAFNETYSIASRLGFKSARKCWQANPRYYLDLSSNKLVRVFKRSRKNK